MVKNLWDKEKTAGLTGGKAGFMVILRLVMKFYVVLRLKEAGYQTSVKDVLYDVAQMKASLIRIDGQEQIVRTKLHGEDNEAFVSIGTQALPRVLQQNSHGRKNCSGTFD